MREGDVGEWHTASDIAVQANVGFRSDYGSDRRALKTSSVTHLGSGMRIAAVDEFAWRQREQSSFLAPPDSRIATRSWGNAADRRFGKNKDGGHRKICVRVVGPALVDSGSDTDYRRFFVATSQDGADALFVDGSPVNVTKRQLIVELAAEFRLPAIYAFRSFVEAGGLMAYGTELGEVFRQAARSIDNILRGTNPGDVPYYQPTKFELVINLGAARALGLTIPSSVLSLADDLID
jgi:hypothetical protein